jgi:hypothetical protein
MLRDVRHSRWRTFGPTVEITGLLALVSGVSVWATWYVLGDHELWHRLVVLAAMGYSVWCVVTTVVQEVRRLALVLGFRDLTTEETRELRRLLGLPPDTDG